jgi:uncharacterized protein
LRPDALAQGQTFPAYTGHVNDFAGVLDTATKTQLETILLNFENRTGAQIALVTIRTLEGRPIEDYANALYRAWGIGAKTGTNKDKGALLLVATEDRRSRLEVGYGLEGDIPDGLAGEMLRRMRPFFQQQQWSQGVTVGIRTIVDTLAQKWNVSLEGIDQSYAYRESPRGNSEESPNWFFIGLIVLFILFSIFGNSGRRGGPGRRRRSWGWGGPLIFHTGGGGFGGGYSGGGSSGGGWGGFGGGGSGGGGASDSW